MAFTRKSLADHLDSYDDEIAELQKSKREMFDDYRAQLVGLGWGKPEIKAEVEALKVAMRRRRSVKKQGSDAVEEFDAIADEIYEEITRAPRATHVASAVPNHDPETGEVFEERRSDAVLNILTNHEDITTAPETAEALEAAE